MCAKVRCNLAVVLLMHIVTQEVKPVLWVAYDDDSYDGPGSAVGSGYTKQEAIDDLVEQLLERGII